VSTTEYAVLGLVGAGEASGYDLARSASRGIAYIWAPSRSQIYKVLPRLEAAGYVSRRDVAQDGRPDKALWRITRSGRAALRAWLDVIEDDPSPAGNVFLLKIYFGWAGRPGADRRQLDAYEAMVRARLAHFEEVERGLPADEPLHSRLALRHGIARARATLDWIAASRRRLRRR
jgi:DNA-binding PadR family transcriptional regulator